MNQSSASRFLSVKKYSACGGGASLEHSRYGALQNVGKFQIGAYRLVDFTGSRMS